MRGSPASASRPTRSARTAGAQHAGLVLEPVPRADVAERDLHDRERTLD